METEAYHPSSIYYEEKKKCYIEEFSFDSAESADAMHGAWERFIAKKIARCPVAYRLTINHDIADHCSLSSILHVPFSAKDSKTVNPDGSSSENRIFHSVFDANYALAVMREELKEKALEPEQELSLKKISPELPEPEINRSHASGKNQEPTRENLHPQPNDKGRTVSCEI